MTSLAGCAPGHGLAAALPSWARADIERYEGTAYDEDGTVGYREQPLARLGLLQLQGATGPWTAPVLAILARVGVAAVRPPAVPA